MNLLNSIAEFLSKLLNWWFTVMPWEQAIHVRRGKYPKTKGPGFYWKIPFVDQVFLQTTRMRMIDVPMQTMSTKDGSTATIKSCVGYSISDINKLYETLYHPEMTLSSMVMAKIGEYIRDTDVKDIVPANIEQAANDLISSKDYGLKDVTIKITTFAIVKTFRLMQDGSGLYENLNMQPTTTTTTPR